MHRFRGRKAERSETRESATDIIEAAHRNANAKKDEGEDEEEKPAKRWWQRRPSLNFITIHYIYIISLTILGSLILFPGDMPFIDAIFFAGGASTQSGLNTIDLNQTYTYQQVILMLWACISTPVFINTIVVFVRLYWFQKRFKHLVEKARDNQRTWAASRTKSMSKSETDLGHLEKGVGDRDIKVLHHTTKPNGMSGHATNRRVSADEAREFADFKTLMDSASSSSREASNTEGSQTLVNGETQHKEQAPETIAPLHHRAITFPDELASPRTMQNRSRDASPLGMTQHIAIVQRQQNSAKAHGGTLRIPGPRDFDRGELPEEIDDQPYAAIQRRGTAESNELGKVTRMLSENSAKSQFNADEHPVRRGITINEPANRPRRLSHVATEEHHGNDAFSIKNGLRRIITPLLPGNRRISNDSEGRGIFARSLTNLSNTFAEKDTTNAPYLSYAATIGRNSAFVGLSEEQREELGGIEYRSLKLLAKILICYYVGFHIIGMMVYLPWILYTQPWKDIVIADGIDPGWWGVFTAASMFNDLGFTLTPDSMISFQLANVILILGSFLIIIGNTGFPVMLRFVIWCLSKFTTNGSPVWEELHFLLDHPRRCFTLLFPSRANWILFGILCILNGIDLVFFIILDLNDPTVDVLPPGYRVLNGWFQAASTRTAGFASVNIADLHPAIQVSYLIMMYISVLPIAMSVRRTNVYEEASLGVYSAKDTEADMNDKSFVAQHLRMQLSFDLWFVFLGFFIIAIVEGSRLSALDDPAFSMFAVLFEIVSAYGTVGLSLGYPTINASFSAELGTISKLVILAMMIRGRHRGLPYALDRAVLLPSEDRFLRESEEAARRYGRRSSAGGQGLRKASASGEPVDAETILDGVDPMTREAGGGIYASRVNRRASNASEMSHVTTARETLRQRGIGFAKLLASGLSAGPTMSKYD